MYSNLHKKDRNYGKTGVKLLSFAKAIIDEYSFSSVLDYGCGKGELGKALMLERPNLKVCLFDPYIEDYAMLPNSAFDCAVCTDVLEHLPEDTIEGVLFDIKERSKNVFFVISTTFAD